MSQTGWNQQLDYLYIDNKLHEPGQIIVCRLFRQIVLEVHGWNTNTTVSVLKDFIFGLNWKNFVWSIILLMEHLAELYDYWCHDDVAWRHSKP